MILTSLKQLNTNLFRTIILSNDTRLKSITSILKAYIGDDWHNQEYTQRNKYEAYSEAYIFTPYLLKTKYKDVVNPKTITNNDLIVKLIKWDPNYEGLLHNHDNNYCYFKILKGELNETIVNSKLKNNLEKTHKKDDIGFICDSIGEHKIKNLSDDFSYSLHVYFKDRINLSHL